MKNLKDAKTKILPSTTRGGKELPSSSALDSPSVLSKLATPTPPPYIEFRGEKKQRESFLAFYDTEPPPRSIGYEHSIYCSSLIYFSVAIIIITTEHQNITFATVTTTIILLCY